MDLNLIPIKIGMILLNLI